MVWLLNIKRDGQEDTTKRTNKHTGNRNPAIGIQVKEFLEALKIHPVTQIENPKILFSRQESSEWMLFRVR